MCDTNPKVVTLKLISAGTNGPGDDSVSQYELFAVTWNRWMGFKLEAYISARQGPRRVPDEDKCDSQAEFALHQL